MSLQDMWFLLTQFLHTGGWVLTCILLLAGLLISLLLERYWFRWVRYPQVFRGLTLTLRQQPFSYRQDSLRCDIDLQLQQHLSLIKVLIALCPLIGLLGTVTGMVHVFDSLALNGTGNARLMAAGISRATLPTMAGMAVAVFGLIFYTHLARWSTRARMGLYNEEGAVNTAQSK
ncbi:MotA/TolQ/ExbB proton channel family protein [Motilimonas pumila]|nr:MotA/TolQ/ExbB proton channel family protein [Motilimonas pumila]